jgi:hypothetical protein
MATTAAGSVVADQQRDGERDARQGQTEADRRGRGKDRDDRQGQDRRRILGDLAQVDGQRRLKEEDRHEDDEKDRGTQRQVDHGCNEIIEEGGQRRIEQKRRQAADGYAHDGEENGVGKAEPFGRRLNQADNDEKARDDQSEGGDADQITGSSRSDSMVADDSRRRNRRSRATRITEFGKAALSSSRSASSC